MSGKRVPSPISLHVNERKVRINPTDHANLLALLRHELKLTGTKSGCASGNCGACTVLVDDRAMQACQLGLVAVEKSHVKTVEHIVKTSLGQQIVSALTRASAAQCGYCLPGIVVAAYAEMLTADASKPANALRRNLCRCGAHSRILAALQELMAAPESGVDQS